MTSHAQPRIYPFPRIWVYPFRFYLLWQFVANKHPALTTTGLIWVRYSFVITPVNYSLAAVNAFVGGTGAYQLFRVVRFAQHSGLHSSSLIKWLICI